MVFICCVFFVQCLQTAEGQGSPDPLPVTGKGVLAPPLLKIEILKGKKIQKKRFSENKVERRRKGGSLIQGNTH